MDDFDKWLRIIIVTIILSALAVAGIAVYSTPRTCIPTNEVLGARSRIVGGGLFGSGVQIYEFRVRGKRRGTGISCQCSVVVSEEEYNSLIGTERFQWDKGKSAE